ncbi:non-ribosomal peptide synthetase, partial [Salinactinospora qingdaonensis]|uniref:non-ribosomal peptide synthetase n=1 Tax=Salinactinospora qingdaonensis TaxID=702744 RepID=UPI0031ECD326
FGATTSGRPAELPGVEEALGLFINTLPVRVSIDPATPAATWLRDLQERQVAARAHDYLPLSTIQAEAGLQGDTQLFDSLVVVENYPVDERAAHEHGLTIGDVTANEATNYPLTLSAYVTERIRLLIGYEPACFDTATVHRLLGDLERILASLVHDPQRPLGRMAGADPAAVAAFVDGGASERPEHSVPELFARQVRRSPEATALVAADGEWSYAELDARATELADHLRAHGVAAESRVLLALPRSPRVVVAMLAVLKAGAAYVPVHSAVPAERVAALAADTGATVAIVDSTTADRCAQAGVATLLHYEPEDLSTDGIDPAAAPPREATARAQRAEPLPASAAYVMFTSGSTGVPKGVVVDHRNIASLAADRRWSGDHERVLFHSPHAFDAATYEIWVPLLNGGTVVAAEEEISTELVAGSVRDHGVSALFVTTALFNLFSQQEPGCFSGLRQVWIGGEAAEPSSIARVRRACPDTEVVNGYGPTETTTFATCTPISLERALAEDCPIGRPMDGTRTHILDAALRPVPVGAVGELYISGDGLARGYDARPGLTAERFVADPFGSGGRLYRTGDLVRWNGEGHIEFVGRADGQIKLRGFRLELGEVESALARLPEVAQAAATVVEAPSGGQVLAGYLTAAGSQPPDTRAVRERLAQTLPAYMVPSVLTVVPELPINHNGKVDRPKLPEPDWAGLVESDYAAPEGVTEEVVAEIWAKTLNLERVGRHDNFFDIGGDSLKSVQVVREIKDTLDIAVPTRALFDHQTVRSYATAVEAALADQMGT